MSHLIKTLRRKPSLLHNTRGVTAVEFGILIIPFFAMVFAIMEIYLIFLAGQTLDHAVSMSARKIRTGIAHNQNLTSQQFKDDICSNVTVFFDCQQRVKIEVIAYDSFDDVTINPLQSINGPTGISEFELTGSYDIGEGRSIIFVRAILEYPILGVDLIGTGPRTFSELGNGKKLLISTQLFRNEPFKT